MTDSDWPSVGLQDPASSISQHASNIRIDIENLHRHIAQGADSVPSETFLQFSFSIMDFTDKILSQPGSAETWSMINRIDQNVKVILEKFLESEKTGSLGKQKTDQLNLSGRESKRALVGDAGVDKDEPSDAKCTTEVEASTATQVEEQTWTLGFGSLLEDDNSEYADGVDHSPRTTLEEPNDFPMQEQGWLLDFDQSLVSTEEEPTSLCRTPSVESFRDTQGGEDGSYLCSLFQGSIDIEDAKGIGKAEQQSSYGPTHVPSILQSNAISANRGSSGTKTSKIVLPGQSHLNGNTPQNLDINLHLIIPRKYTYQDIHTPRHRQERNSCRTNLCRR